MQFYSRKVEDTKGVIRNRKSKDRQCNSQKKRDNRTNNILQITSHTIKINDVGQFMISCLGLCFTCSEDYLAFDSFYYERT